MTKLKVSVVIPAYNEAATIGDVIGECRRFCDEIIVIDDEASTIQPELLRIRGQWLSVMREIRG